MCNMSTPTLFKKKKTFKLMIAEVIALVGTKREIVAWLCVPGSPYLSAHVLLPFSLVLIV